VGKQTPDICGASRGGEVFDGGKVFWEWVDGAIRHFEPNKVHVHFWELILNRVENYSWLADAGNEV